MDPDSDLGVKRLARNERDEEAFNTVRDAAVGVGRLGCESGAGLPEAGLPEADLTWTRLQGDRVRRLSGKRGGGGHAKGHAKSHATNQANSKRLKPQKSAAHENAPSKDR